MYFYISVVLYEEIISLSTYLNPWLFGFRRDLISCSFDWVEEENNYIMSLCFAAATHMEIAQIWI